MSDNDSALPTMPSDDELRELCEEVLRGYAIGVAVDTTLGHPIRVEYLNAEDARLLARALLARL